MKVSYNGHKLIKQFESCRLKAYQNPGDLVSIGYGNTYYEDGAKVRLGDVITKDRADALFRIVLAEFEIGVERLLKVKLNQNQFDAIVSFAYNVGLGNLGKSTLLKKINKDPNDPTIADEFPKWRNKGTIYEKGLLKRRQQEVALYFKK